MLLIFFATHGNAFYHTKSTDIHWKYIYRFLFLTSGVFCIVLKGVENRRNQIQAEVCVQFEEVISYSDCKLEIFISFSLDLLRFFTDYTFWWHTKLDHVEHMLHLIVSSSTGDRLTVSNTKGLSFHLKSQKYVIFFAYKHIDTS